MSVKGPYSANVNSGKIKEVNELRHRKSFFQSTFGNASRTVTEIQAIEDRLAGLQHEFREIRNSMRESEMETVDLALNTFTLYLDKMEPMAKKYRGQLEEQQAVLSAKQARERKRTEIAQKQKKSGK